MIRRIYAKSEANAKEKYYVRKNTKLRGENSG
jgi:hypothetical protein